MKPPKLRWVVSEPTVLVALLERLGDGIALAEGRVFVDGQRARDAQSALEPGVRVELYEPAEAPASVELLDQRGDLFAVHKPAGLATEPDRSGTHSLIGATAELCGVPACELHALTRLDRGVSGVVLFASSREARHHIELLREGGGLCRRYVALAERAPLPPRGRWTNPVGGRAATSAYACIAELPADLRAAGSGRTTLRPALLALEPKTGRRHQLRIHASEAGAALLGDRQRGGAGALVVASGKVYELRRIFLHAARLKLRDLAGNAWLLAAPLPDELRELWSVAGGTDGDWDRALADDALAAR